MKTVYTYTGNNTHQVRNINAKITIGVGSAAAATISVSFDDDLTTATFYNLSSAPQIANSVTNLYLMPGIKFIRFVTTATVQVMEYYEPGTQ